MATITLDDIASGDLWRVTQHLALVRQKRRGSTEDAEIIETLSQLKKEAVAADNQHRAKQIWCLETIQNIQNLYLDAFQSMKQQNFYSAWCALERVEIELGNLVRHLNPDNEGKDEFALTFIAKHVQQFQSLFPYKMFSSPGFLIQEKVCTICEQPVSIRHPCGHIPGEIYNGESCARRITKVDLQEISFVENPVQKYSVTFLGSAEHNHPIDHYNYAAVDYLVRGLRHPFAPWDIEWTTITQPLYDFRNIGRNDICPCGSGKKFKRCCLRTDRVEHKHLQIHFHEAPPDDLPPCEPVGTVVRGKDFDH